MAGRAQFDPRIDYYAVFDLTLTASADQIQSVFRQRAKQIHPDRNPDAEATRQFQRLSEAYAILSDPLMRAEYDQARASINVRAAFQTYARDRARDADRSAGEHWRQVLRGLTRSPYRYVFLLLAMVAVANVIFILLTGSFKVDSSAAAAVTLTDSPSPEVSPTTASVLLTPASDTSAVNLLAEAGCDPGAQISSPQSNAIIAGPFEVDGLVKTDFQLDWAPILYDPGGHPQHPDWHVLSSGKSSEPDSVLAPPAMTNAIARPMAIFLRLTVGNPGDKQPIQVCVITVSLQK